MTKSAMNFKLHEPVKPHEMGLTDNYFFFYQKSAQMYNLCS
jgi:hypothetical protein